MKKSKAEENEADSEEETFPVVGIGASAGGLEALEAFFEQVPKDSGIAYVVIQHLDPTRKGALPELLQRNAVIPVYQVEEKTKVQPDCIYIIPPNKNMAILDNVLHLLDPPEKRGLRLPIDFFFQSLAEDQGEAGVGIILSGMGSDGSLGLGAIKEKGGVIMVQDPLTAKFDGMPRSAIKKLPIDVIAGPGELPAELMELMDQLPVLESKLEKVFEDGLNKIILFLRDHTGNDFSRYKKNTVARRIKRRMAIHKLEEVISYLLLLERNPKEADILFKELLIGVTSFFRDPPVWQFLREKIFPALFARTQPGTDLRAWVAGCSTGEEAYSLALTFMECLEEHELRRHYSLQIFATDLSKDSIEFARKGLFPASIEANVSPKLLKRFFIKTGDKYQIKTVIREMIVFAPHNLIMDPPFTKLDFLSCRNLLIYMNTALQNKLLELFHYSLNPEGVLLLGKAESLRAQQQLFKEVDSKLKIFESSAAVAPKLTDFPTSFSQSRKVGARKSKTVQSSDNIPTLADKVLLRQYAPVGVLVNENGDIIYISSRAGKYLEPAVGKANLNIFSMTREGLRQEFPAAFRKALQNRSTVVLPEINMEADSGRQSVEVSIQWLADPKPLRGLLLIVFKNLPNKKPEKTLVKSRKNIPAAREKQLELEMVQLKKTLQNTVQEMQTSQEELKTANEELQSSNEELQSTNEELMTSKEEMQSMNEELQTVNSELRSKMNNYLKVNSEMNNLLRSTNIATLFLDKQLNVRNYTEQATNIFKLRQSDVGRPFTDQITTLDYPKLADDAREVLYTLIPMEKQITTQYGRWYLLRIMPFRTFEDKIDGLVITFVDITKQKKMELKLGKTEELLRLFLNTSSNVVVGLTPEWTILELNPQAEDFFGINRATALGCNFFELFVHRDVQEKVKKDMEKLLKTDISNISVETNIRAGEEGFQKAELSAHAIFDEEGRQTRVIIIVQTMVKNETG